MLVSIDFEYNKSNEVHPTLVSCAVGTPENKKVFWLHKNPQEQQKLKEHILSYPKDAIFLAYAVTAEARSYLALDLAPLNFKWIDLYLEYRCLLNHNHKLSYGKQLIDGKVKRTFPPKKTYGKTQEESEDDDRSKPEYGLAAACFKLLDRLIDTDRKNRIRDLIISAPVEFTQDERKEILEYNLSDIDYLPQLLRKMLEEYKRLLGDRYNPGLLQKEMFLRSEYACRTAIMESVGYPIDVEATRSFSSQVPSILFRCQKEIAELFPDNPPFRREKYKYVMDTKAIRKWIASTPYAKKWMLTDGGKKGIKQLSLKKDAFNKFFNPRHEYKEDCYGEQVVRFLVLKQNLNGFLPGGKKGNFWDYVGSDGRVRPYFGIYGAQSARSQPKATGFLFLKSAWMRSLCMPKPGRAIAGIDYKSQEALIAALLSRDPKMLEAYKSGDPYFYLAKLSGKVPWSGTRKEYELERSVFKIVFLALQYGMGKYSLATELYQKLGLKYTPDEAQSLIDTFNKGFLKHYIWKGKFLAQYRKHKFVKLPCGWTMWGDNDNDRSAGNVPIQGLGSSIMRKAVALAQDAGLTVIKTLHDAIYIEYDSFDFAAIDILGKCMLDAFQFYFPEDQKKDAVVGLEANTWSPDYAAFEGMSETPGGLELKIQEKYLDKRGAKEYDKFKEYLQPMEFDL